MLPYDKLQRGFANKQTTCNLDLAGVLQSKEGTKIFPAKTKLAFVDSYYSPCGPLGITPGRFYYHNAKFWAENLGTLDT